MARKPPLLPAETLRRVIRMGRFDGAGVLAIAGAFALAAASVHDVTSVEVGLVVAAAGAMELHGAGLLRSGEERGITWLVASQLFLLAVILVYVGWRLHNVDIAPMRQFLMAEQRDAIAKAGMSVDDFLRFVYTATYAVFGFASLLYQGGMALYYHRRRAAVALALQSSIEH